MKNIGSMQLELPENIVYSSSLEEGFYYVGSFLNGGGVSLLNSDENITIEITLEQVYDILNHNNGFLSEKNKVKKLTIGDILYI